MFILNSSIFLILTADYVSFKSIDILDNVIRFRYINF